MAFIIVLPLQKNMNLFMKPQYDELMTIGELKRWLEGLPDDDKIFFGCESLKFYRIKQRGDGLHQIEFNQTVSDNANGEVFIDSFIDD